MNVDQATTTSDASSEKAPSTPVLRLNIHQPFETFPAATVIDEYVAQEEGEDDFIKGEDLRETAKPSAHATPFSEDVMQEMFDIMLELKQVAKLIFSESASLICYSGASTRIWSECRPKAEIEQFANAMDDKLKLIEEKEQGQGMSLMERARRNLVAFVASIQTALAALSNF